MVATRSTNAEFPTSYKIQFRSCFVSFVFIRFSLPPHLVFFYYTGYLFRKPSYFCKIMNYHDMRIPDRMLYASNTRLTPEKLAARFKSAITKQATDQ